MTERKPANMSWQSWIEHQIDRGQREGAFDDLPGHGKPIDDLDQPHDELRWVRKKLRAEGANHLPPALAIRTERDQAIGTAMSAPDETEVRRTIETVNERIRYLNSHNISGPPTSVTTIDADAIVDRWRSQHR